MSNEHNPAPQSLSTIAFLRSQRSTQAPATGPRTTPGSVVVSRVNAYLVTEPVIS